MGVGSCDQGFIDLRLSIVSKYFYEAIGHIACA